jgi:hypothetical protein
MIMLHHRFREIEILSERVAAGWHLGGSVSSCASMTAPLPTPAEARSVTSMRMDHAVLSMKRYLRSGNTSIAIEFLSSLSCSESLPEWLHAWSESLFLSGPMKAAHFTDTILIPPMGLVMIAMEFGSSSLFSSSATITPSIRVKLMAVFMGTERGIIFRLIYSTPDAFSIWIKLMKLSGNAWFPIGPRTRRMKSRIT